LAGIFGRLTGGFSRAVFPPASAVSKRGSVEETARRMAAGNAPELIAWVKEPDDEIERRLRANLVLNLETAQGGKNRKSVVTAMVSVLKR